MRADRYLPVEELCPVRDELLSELYCANATALPVLLAPIAPAVRAMLAIFCYRRCHLHTIGVAIAASCREDELVRSGGRLGAALFTISREAPALRSPGRRKITLATGPLRKMTPMVDEPDDAFGKHATSL
jgi:hypothetical protein